MKVLLIWQEIPEYELPYIRYYLVSDPTQAQLDTLTRANDLFFNSIELNDEQKSDLEKVHCAICGEGVYYGDDKKEWVGIWEKSEIEARDLSTYTYWDRVITCGTYL